MHGLLLVLFGIRTNQKGGELSAEESPRYVNSVSVMVKTGVSHSSVNLRLAVRSPPTSSLDPLAAEAKYGLMVHFRRDHHCALGAETSALRPLSLCSLSLGIC